MVANEDMKSLEEVEMWMSVGTGSVSRTDGALRLEEREVYGGFDGTSAEAADLEAKMNVICNINLSNIDWS